LRIAIVQYGVLHSVFTALRAGGPETFYAQRYSVDFVADLAQRSEFVGVCGFLGNKARVNGLSANLDSACIPLTNGAINAPTVIELLEEWRPDKLILQTPDRRILKWALRNRIDTLPLLADSFEQNGIRERYRAFRLARLLSHTAIRAVANHNVPSCLSLARIGVSPDKIYPWDWPHDLRPESHPVKSIDKGPARLVYVGTLTPSKGVGDCIDAARILTADGVEFEMTVVGGGDFTDRAQAMIEGYGLSDRVRLAGRLPHDAVVEMLKGATVAMTPSWHDYPEGLPMTIYEALATRTPIALSDHPMFQLYFRDTPAARMAPEKNPEALAAAVKALLSDKQTYAAASDATGALWSKIKCDLTWGRLITAWLGENGASLDDIADERLSVTFSAPR